MPRRARHETILKIRCPHDFKRRLDGVAELRGQTTSEFARATLIAAVERAEDRSAKQAPIYPETHQFQEGLAADKPTDLESASAQQREAEELAKTLEEAARKKEQTAAAPRRARRAKGTPP